MDQTGYIIPENNLNISEFDGEIKWWKFRSFGKPNGNISCGENGEEYTFNGCSFKKQGCSIPDTTGYILILKIKV